MRYLVVVFAVLVSCGRSQSNEKSVFQGKSELRNYNLKGKVKRLTEYTFNSDENLLRTEDAVNRNWSSAFTVYFNSKEQQDSLKEYIKTVKTIDTVTWIIERDAEGLRIRMWSRDQKGKNRGTYVYVNDVAGNELQSRSYDKDSNLLITISNSYNHQSQLYNSEKTDYSGKSLGRIKYYWDSTYHLMKLEEFTNRGVLKYFFIRTYDASGKMTTSTDSSGSLGIITAFDYISDKMGNYIIRKATQRGNITETLARVIEYY